MTTAFPITDNQGIGYGQQGITLLDYFAGQALNGAIQTIAAHDTIDYSLLAKDCYLAAEAMIIERGKLNEQ